MVNAELFFHQIPQYLNKKACDEAILRLAQQRYKAAHLYTAGSDFMKLGCHERLERQTVSASTKKGLDN